MAAVERFKQGPMYGQSAKKGVIVDRWPLVEVRLQFAPICNTIKLIIIITIIIIIIIIINVIMV